MQRGWQVFEAESATQAWAQAALAPAVAATSDPAERRHGGTWCAGVDALPNDADGAVPGGSPLDGQALAQAKRAMGRLALHPAQVSVVHPGYPRRDPGEGEAAHRYRRLRDAAHLDGLLPEGPRRRRHLREPHAYILGIALTGADAGASPLVVWEGSQEIMRTALSQALAGTPPGQWGEVDLTDTYQAARRRCFELCPRREIPLALAEAVLMHRLSLHGIAPWEKTAKADAAGRVIAYFRPILSDVEAWLAAP